MKLTIVIPALDEEQSIKSIIEKCLSAKGDITKKTAVDEVNVVVVSDGSTDNTVKYAQEYADKIDIIIFEKNKGYGAAIKEGWEQSNGDLLGFLDADGTCNPLFFIDLINLITKDKADIALGCRINENSEMPFIRRLGNKVFSIMLSFLASQKVKDTASGMRVVRKEILKDIYPLPDGLHFTPAMSAVALSNPDIVILEKDMSYSEREGDSKLHVLKDGIRFFKIIAKSSFMYRPHVILITIAFFIAILSIALIVNPTIHYLKHKEVMDFAIYRFCFSGLGSILTTLLLSIAYISEKIVTVSILKSQKDISSKLFIGKFFSSKLSWLFIVFLLITGFLLVSDSLVSRITTGATNEHWSRYVAMIFIYANAFILLGTKIIDYMLRLIIEKKNYLYDRKKQF